MEQPKTIIVTKEDILVAKNKKSRYVNKAIFIIIIIMILGALFFQDNLFLKLNYSSLVFYLLITANKQIVVSSPLELHFYDDYLLIYRQKRFYDYKVTRQEYYKIYYCDVKDCFYQKKSQQLNFYGIIDYVFYNYNKNGSLPETPTKFGKIDTICYFRTSADKNIDFVSLIEQNTPLKIIIKDV